MLPSALAPAIAASWKKHATTLYGARQLLEGYAHHVDQISFAMAMIDLELDVDELPIEDNFPLHLFKSFAPDADIYPRVLHFHWFHDEKYLLPTGHEGLDRAVYEINSILDKNL